MKDKWIYSLKNGMVFLLILLSLIFVSSPVSAGDFQMPLENEITDLKEILSQTELYEKNPVNNLPDFVYDRNTNAWSAFNSAQSLEIRADDTGTKIISPYGYVRFSLLSVGREDNLIAAEKGVINADGRMLEIVRPDYKEWYLNGDTSPEQGMTLNERPDGQNNLIVTYDISGDLLPVLKDGDLIFFDESGSVLKYSGLKAWDAEGRILETSLSLSKNTICWEIDDKDAVYPVTVDPVMTQVAILSASDKSTGVGFGNYVSISGDYALVGAVLADSGGIDGAGQAYIFSRNQGGDNKWGEVAVLNASDKSADARFGQSVSVSGDYMLVGANGANSSLVAHEGQAYVFYRNQGVDDNWGEVAILNASDKSADANFGSFVSLSGDYALVGASMADPGGITNAGQAYIFYRNQGGDNKWGEVAVLNASDKSADANFGNYVSVSGDYALVGACDADPGGINTAGQAYIFYRNKGGDNNWGEVAILNASDKSSWAYFGYSVSLSGDYALVGAHYADPGITNAGQAYVFYRNQGGDNNWGEVALLNASDKKTGAHFGYSVSLSGDYALVGADGVNSSLAAYSGQAYVFYRNQGGDNKWGEVAILDASDKSVMTHFGWSVSISGDYALVGTPYADSGGINRTGQAYIFVFSDPIFASISPATGINSNNAFAATITGSNFYGTPVVKLKKTGETDITATGVTLAGETQIGCTFNINGTPAGVWDVEIINPNGKSVTGAGVFTVDVPDPIAAPSGGGFNSDTGVGASNNLKAGGNVSFGFEGKGAVYELSLKVGEDTPSLMVTVKKQGSLPSSVDTPDTDVYEYEDVKIYHTEVSAISGAIFKYKVSKSWLSSKGYTKGDVVMLHYKDGEWVSLPTELIGEDSGYYYYSAETPSLSWFAIGIGEGETIILEEEAETPAPAATEIMTPAATTPPVSTEGTVHTESQSSLVMPVILAVAIILLIIIGSKLWQRRQKSKYPEWWDKKL